MEVFAEAAGVVVEDGLGISKTFQNGKHFHGLEQPQRMMAELSACQHFASIKKTPKLLYIIKYCEYLSEMVISAFVQEGEVVDY